MSGNNIDFDSIRRQIDIVNVISSYIPLSATGRNFKGICPFHNDSNPSMMVSPDKQIYKCFSCGASGNVFTFIMNYEKISFIEAVKKACDIQGISIPEIKDVQKVKPVENKNSRLVKLMEEVNEFYHYQLLINSQSEANKYLESRFLGKEIVDEFRIGFCPADGTSSIKYLLNKWPKTVYYAILGLLVASPFSIIYATIQDYKEVIDWTSPWIYIVGVVTLAVGGAVAVGFSIYDEKINKKNIKEEPNV